MCNFEIKKLKQLNHLLINIISFQKIYLILSIESNSELAVNIWGI